MFAPFDAPPFMCAGLHVCMNIAKGKQVACVHRSLLACALTNHAARRLFMILSRRGKNVFGASQREQPKTILMGLSFSSVPGAPPPDISF